MYILYYFKYVSYMYIIYMYISIVSNFHILLILRHVYESKYLVMNVAKYLIKKTFSNYILVCSKTF